MTISREETQARIDLVASGAMQQTPEQHYTIADRFEELAQKIPDNVFLIDEQRRITYAEVNRDANRYAHFALVHGVGPGDVGAVMIQNRPEFFFAWIGLLKIGAIATLINTYSRDRALAHAFDVTGAKLAFIGAECLDNFATAPSVPATVATFVVPDGNAAPTPVPEGARVIDAQLAQCDASDPDTSLRAEVIGKTPAFYVFTSGTTGLPKAAIISHARWLGVGDGWNRLMGITENDVFYCMLPLFHGAAGMSLTSNALAGGASIVLQRKFSASRFWDDVRRYGVTATQYIGEVCRYLVNQPPSPDDRHHALKYMTGAGLTAEVWRKFIERFGDIRIFEGYGGTETNVNMTNVDQKIGSCGRIPFPEKSNARLVRYDIESDDYVRDADGYLVDCHPGEVGELLGMVLDVPGVMGGRFEGYTDPESNEKKILRDVFTEDDAYFRTGDLFYRDEDDYYYFVDRIGDTFRWKSENVSTTEVAEALSHYDDAEMINVYGVRVPDHEGRAGMAAVQMRPGRSFDPGLFYRITVEYLPPYAVPLFVRVSSDADLTPTFKLRKVDLKRQGYDPTLMVDPLYVLSHGHGRYVEYSEAALAELGVPPFDATN